jgi:hypothetical protein
MNQKHETDARWRESKSGQRRAQEIDPERLRKAIRYLGEHPAIRARAPTTPYRAAFRRDLDSLLPRRPLILVCIFCERGQYTNVTHCRQICSKSLSVADNATSHNLSISSAGTPALRKALVTWQRIEKSLPGRESLTTISGCFAIMSGPCCGIGECRAIDAGGGGGDIDRPALKLAGTADVEGWSLCL